MPAYAALISLQQTLGIILDSGGLRPIPGIKDQLQSLATQVDLFLNFLVNNPGGQIPLESKMRKEAYEAEERIESYINTRSRNSLIITVCNISYIVLGALLISSYVWIQRYAVLLLASFSIVIIYAVVTHLALNAGNDNESKAGRLRQVSDEFDGIQSQVKGIQQPAQAVLSLLRETLDSFLASDSGRFISDNCRGQLQSLRDQVRPESQWLKFLKNDEHPEAADDIKDAASKVKDLIESELSVRHSSIWTKFCILIKDSLLASWICLLVLALLMTTMLTFIISKLSFATSSHDINIRVYTLIPLALGIGVYVFIARELAFQNRSKSVEQELSEEIGSLERIMKREENASETATAAQDLEGRNAAAAAAVVGLVSDILVIKELLLDNSRQVEIVSIVGMGGIGKTTLAKNVYDDAAITYRFDIRAWVTVSQKYTVCHVLQRLLGCINIQPGVDEGESTLGDRLYKALFGRRFLVVIDDLWGTEVWYAVKTYFPRIENGSRLLLTSRFRYQEFAGRYCHPMRHLDKEASWVLLQRTVFGGGSPCPENLKDCGKAIAKGCGGLPLAIVVIGTVLPRDNLGEWKKVEEKLMNSQSTKLIDKCLEILGLSYDNLPHHLRPCFLYMGLLPTYRDEIPVSKLSSLWAAEGFLKPGSSELVAEEYLKELCDRNMISVSKRSFDGKIRACRIHSLWRRFCVKTAGDQKFLHVVGVSSSSTPHPQVPNPQTLRRLSIYPDAVQVDASSRYLRSFFCSSDKLSNCPSVGCFSKFSFISSRAKLLNYPSAGFSGFGRLRVLDVLVLHCEAFPGQIIELVSLRYLALSCNSPLPPSISNLRYLETIVHHHRSDHRYPLLPTVIWSMPNLRHLYVKPGCYLSDPHLPSVLVPRHLQTLKGIRNFKWSKDIIERVPNLKKLELLYDASSSSSSSSSSVDWSAYELECLVDLSQLEALKITVNNIESFCSPPTLAFPQQLKKLSLSGCGIPWDSNSIGALPSLEALKLRRGACSGRLWKTVGVGFPRLTYLLLEKINLETWNAEEAHFPCLQRLVIRSCRVLDGIPYIPTLEMIELVGCHSSATDFAKQIKQQQEEETGESLTICVSAA